MIRCLILAVMIVSGCEQTARVGNPSDGGSDSEVDSTSGDSASGDSASPDSAARDASLTRARDQVCSNFCGCSSSGASDCREACYSSVVYNDAWWQAALECWETSGCELGGSDLVPCAFSRIAPDSSARCSSWINKASECEVGTASYPQICGSLSEAAWGAVEGCVLREACDDYTACIDSASELEGLPRGRVVDP